MACAVEMASYWFLCPPVCDVVAMSVEADVEGDSLRRRRESYWIKQLRSLHPEGMNLDA